jgi:Flp pilus assembly pilin Flp
VSRYVLEARVLLPARAERGAVLRHAERHDTGRVPSRRHHMREFITEIQEESGQTMAEYAVVLGVITIAVVVTLGLLSTAIQNTLNNVIASL